MPHCAAFNINYNTTNQLAGKDMINKKKIAAVFAALASVSTFCGWSEATSAEGPVSPKPAAMQSAGDLYMDYLNRDVRDDIFYFVLPDRFENGDPSNDEGSAPGTPAHGGFIPTDKGYYHGGDLAGLTAKLDYLKDMGVTAVWLTPIMLNQAFKSDGSGYHGYWILDFSKIDPHLGRNDELNKLIDTAHEKGMKVVFDIIVNHTADVIKFRECHNNDGSFREDAVIKNGEQVLCPFKTWDQITSADQYSPFIPAGQENIKYPAWLNDIQYYNNRGDSVWVGESVITGDFIGLDDLDTSQQAVIDGFIDIYKNIVKEFKPDGFRIDTVKHVDMSFWEQFSPALFDYAKEIGIPNFVMFGEVATRDAAFLSRYSTIGQLSSTLDFALFEAMEEVFAKNGSPQRLARLFEDDDYYGDHDSDASFSMNFNGNHDEGRIGYLIDRALPKASDKEKMQRSLLSHAFLYFARGIPIVYYGDEQGFTGDGRDKDAREDMMPSVVDVYNDNNLLGTDATTAADNFDQNHPIYKALASYAEVYKGHSALRQGVQYTRFASEKPGIIALSRVDKAEQVEYLVAFNTSTKKQSVKLDASAASYTPVHGADKTLDASSGKVELSVPPLGFVIYRAESALAPVSDLSLALKSAHNDKRSPAFVDITYTLAAEKASVIPWVKVTTEVKNADGSFELVAEDFNAPFAAKLLRSKLSDERATIRVTADNLNGESKTQTIEIDVR